MSGISRRAWRVWQRNFDVFLQTWHTQITFTVIEPLIVLVAMGFGLGNYVNLGGGASYLAFLAPGLIAAYAMWGTAAECSWGSFFRMDQQRTFDAMIVTPLSIEDVITGEVLWGASRAIETTLALMAVFLVFQVPMAFSVFLAVPAMFLMGVVFAATGLVVVSQVRNVAQLNHFATLFLIPQYMFAGVFFPLDGLPEWAQTVGWFLPLSHGVNLSRSLVSGTFTPGMLADMVWLLLAAAGMYMLALHKVRERLIT